MELTQRIKRGRRQRKVKRPFAPSLFTRAAGIVREHRLGPDFLDELDAALEGKMPSEVDSTILREKGQYGPSLFALVTEAEYRTARGIVERIRNPYLLYANSPDEILLCNLLFSADPGIDPELLIHNHFAVLLRKALASAPGEHVVQ